MSRLPLLLVLLSACRWFADRPEPDETHRSEANRGETNRGEAARPDAAQRPARPEALSPELLKGVVQQTSPRFDGAAKRDIADLGPDEPPLVVLVVLDTLRADRTSLCGYEAPTTPILKQLVELGATWTCDAYSPATWTLPSHASYFTGASTAEHGVHTHGTALGEGFEALAETYAARGYQTLFISGNPVFSHKATGFWQGFDRVVSAKALVGPLRGPTFVKMVEAEIAKVDKKKPLFLVVNVFDAHDPYPAVPDGLDWAKAQDRTNLLPHTAKPENPYYRFVTGEMAAEERPEYLAGIHNAYQWAVHSADENLGRLMGVLKRNGWLKHPRRIVVTSDHGEHLGEHDLLRHGSAAWQTVTRVPFLVYDSEHPVAELPRPMSVTNAYWLLRDGKLPDAPVLVESASMTNPDDFKPSWFTVALWASPTDKLLHFDGDDRRYDLAVDPLEEHPVPLDAAHPLKALLDARVAAQRESFDRAMSVAPDADVMKLLAEVGYVQDLPDDDAPAPPPEAPPE